MERLTVRDDGAEAARPLDYDLIATAYGSTTQSRQLNCTPNPASQVMG